MRENVKDTSRVVVYISSPYTQGDMAVNVKFQLDIVEELYQMNFLPFSPLYSHFQHLVHPKQYEEWMDIDLRWVEKADCLLRLGGYSPGGDREVAYAKELGIPVFFGLEELEIYYKYNNGEIDGE